MKKLLYLFLLGCLFSCHSKKSGKGTEAPIASLPSFNLLLMDSATILNTGDIKAGNPIVLMYFSPDCEHCQQQVKNILQNATALNDTKIFMFTPMPFAELKSFYHNYHLDQYKNIVVAEDYEYAFYKYFKATSFPYTAIYDADKKLVRLYKSEIKAAQVIEAVHS